MIVYNETKKKFLDDFYCGNLIPTIDQILTEKYHKTSESEINAWRNSLAYMNIVISRANVPDDCGVAIEYMIPTSSKRIDFLITGYDDNGDSNTVIVELKQWSSVKSVENKKDIVSTYVAGREREVAHPSYQAWSYARLMYDYNENIRKHPIKLYPCAYLHNYTFKENDTLLDSSLSDVVSDVPVFDMHGAFGLTGYIETYIKKPDNKSILEDIEYGKIKPSKSLQDSIASMIKNNPEFTMIDEQKVIYEQVLTLAQRCREDRKKRVLIVEGGPGTGKTVLAIRLLAYLLNKGLNCNYISKNAAPRDVYKEKLKGNLKISSIDSLFKGSGSFVNTMKNEMDIAIVDEAHRLNAKSGFYGNQGENQIKEIINASLFSIFFIDEAQRVTIKDIGSISEIKKFAIEKNCEIYTNKLESQFRCNGSDGYLGWIDDILGIRETANKIFDFDYDFKVVDNPHDMLEWVKEKNKINNKSRIIAGYCWEWPKSQKNNSMYKDIKIDEYEFYMSWNLLEGTWAIDESSVEEAGCIHTSQGLEFDYVGIIIGDDMRYEDGHIITDFRKRAKSDQSLKGIKKMYKIDSEKAKSLADEIIRNTYRTLLTRGMKGCRVFCTDKNLSKYLKEKSSSYAYEGSTIIGDFAAEDRSTYL